MKNRYSVIVAIMMFCLSIPALKAQSIYFSFNDGSHSSYLISTVRNITFTGNVMNLNKTDGTSDSWNVSTICNYNYSDFNSILPEISNDGSNNLFIYPNPANGPVNIQYQVQQVGDVKIEVMDINGKLIKALPQKQQSAGSYIVTWNGADEKGNYISGGVYFCKITMGSTSILKKIIITNQ